MEHRDRAAGWQHAKLSGHKNEDLVKALLDRDEEYAAAFLNRVGASGRRIRGTSVGGLHETKEPSVSGKRKTKSKTDLKVFLDDGSTVNVSIKKSLCGQVYFVRAGLFIDVFEKQFQRKIPDGVQRAIRLFWAAADDAVEILERYADRSDPKTYDLQLRHKCLNATTLKAYSEELYEGLKTWFVENAYEIAALCFSMGAVRDREEWSDYIWYINLLAENETDAVFSIEEICNAVQANAEAGTDYSTTNGGTTIQLPFGFVQWHQGQLQFHHSYYKLREILG